MSLADSPPTQLTASGEDVMGFVLAGGQSSRMGRDKALTLFQGQPLIAVALATLRAAGLSAAVAGARSDLSAFAPVISDVSEIEVESGPMAGIFAALAGPAAEWNVFLPVDLPLMPAALLRCLIQRARLTGSPVTAVRLNGRLEPFPVVLRRSILPCLAQRLATGQRACHLAWRALPAELGSTLDAPAVENLIQTGHCTHPSGLPPSLWFQSANTPTDLVRLNRLAAQVS